MADGPVLRNGVTDYAGPLPIKTKKINGMVQVYTGAGKGKTTASLGLAMRALGHGFDVCMIQFLKGGTYLGEIESAKKFKNFKLKQFGIDCPWAEQLKDGKKICGSCRYCFSVLKEDQKLGREALEAAKEAVSSGKHDLVILDEINVAMNIGLVDTQEIIKMLKNKAKETEVVLTGRNAPKEIIDFADLVTEMKLIKHPMLNGHPSRMGIEF